MPRSTARRLSYFSGILCLGLIGWLVQQRLWVEDPLMKGDAGRYFALARELADQALPLPANCRPVKPRSFAQYLAEDPIRLTAERSRIYLQPLGNWAEKDLAEVDGWLAFLSEFFAAPVIRMERPMPPTANSENWPTDDILDSLAKDLPTDAALLVGLTITAPIATETPQPKAIGFHSPHERVGICVLPVGAGRQAVEERANEGMLTRILFGVGTGLRLPMCGAHACLWNDRESTGEFRFQPLCPECQPNLWFATRADPHERFLRLEKQCRDLGWETFASQYHAYRERIRNNPF